MALSLRNFAPEKQALNTIKTTDGLYLLPNPSEPNRAPSARRQPRKTAKNWHEKLGHTDMERVLQSTQKSEGVPNFSYEELRNIYFPSCNDADAKRAPHLSSSEVA